jgi:potassium channel subfamily K, invertebrate
MCIANISGVLGDMFRYVYSRVCCRLCIKKKLPKEPVPNQYDHDLATARDVIPVWGTDDELKEKAHNNKQNLRADNDSFFEDNNLDKVSVPLTVTMLIILGYLGVGAVIYKFTEGWSWVESIYFCFITLATIGNF